MEKIFSVKGNIVDVVSRRIFPGEIFVENGKIVNILERNEEYENYILPGLIDSHVHIESSMLIPSRFSYFAVKNGVVAVITDPHEIANVLGIKGVDFMIEDSKKVPLKVYFGAPSCVPATSFETSGAVLDSKAVNELLKRKEIYFLSEMMNFPGVVFGDEEVLKKIEAAKKHGKPVDGHAPGLSGEDLKKYVQAGISTDHECFTLEEAEEKIALGMKIQIREGSAAKNFEALYPLIDKYPDKVMLCTDDSHPDDLKKGYINKIVKMAFAKGLDVFNVLRAATLNPVKHYGLDVGLLQEGDFADFIVVDNLENFNVLQTYINGQKIYDGENVLFDFPELTEKPNKFVKNYLMEDDLRIEPKSSKIRVIKAFDGELITETIVADAKIENNNVVSDVENDILKIIVLNRYQKAKPAIGFITGIGLKQGAIATTVAHDSHNIIAVGVNDYEILKVVNKLIDLNGGLVVSKGDENLEYLTLDVAGLMSAENNPLTVAEQYENLNKLAKELGTPLHAPFMTLSFMALLVIPELKLSDKGLFDGKAFKFTVLFV